MAFNILSVNSCSNLLCHRYRCRLPCRMANWPCGSRSCCPIAMAGGHKRISYVRAYVCTPSNKCAFAWQLLNFRCGTKVACTNLMPTNFIHFLSLPLPLCAHFALFAQAYKTQKKSGVNKEIQKQQARCGCKRLF